MLVGQAIIVLESWVTWTKIMMRCTWMSFMFIVARVTCKTICSKTFIVVHRDMGALKNDSKTVKMVVAYIW